MAKILQYLNSPMFTIQMGWERWGTATRIKWTRELREACQETIRLCESELERLEDASS